MCDSTVASNNPLNTSSDGLTFGSAHASGFSMVTCDGAVHKMSYNIDPDVHRRYGDCRDKTPVDLTPLSR